MLFSLMTLSVKYQEDPPPLITAGEITENLHIPGMPLMMNLAKKLKVVLAFLLPVILLTAGYLVYEYWYAAPARQESEIEKALELESKSRKEKEAAISKKEVPVIEVPVIPEVGTIETITAPTGKFYIVAHSSIDGDLIMDRAKALSSEGVSTSIIPPFGRWKFYRLAITNDQTFPLAQEKADQLKEKYGKDLWVMRY